MSWCYHIEPGINGNDWHCIPDGTYPSADKAWDAMEDHVRRIAESRDDDEEFQVWIVRRPVEVSDCQACSAEECPARLAEVSEQ